MGRVPGLKVRFLSLVIGHEFSTYRSFCRLHGDFCSGESRSVAPLPSLPINKPRRHPENESSSSSCSGNTQNALYALNFNCLANIGGHLQHFHGGANHLACTLPEGNDQWRKDFGFSAIS